MIIILSSLVSHCLCDIVLSVNVFILQAGVLSLFRLCPLGKLQHKLFSYSCSGICWYCPLCVISCLDTLRGRGCMTWCPDFLLLTGEGSLPTQRAHHWKQMNGKVIKSFSILTLCSSPLSLSISPSPSVSHNDLALQLRILHSNRLSQIDLHNFTKVATDITRLQAGHVQAQVLSLCRQECELCVRGTSFSATKLMLWIDWSYTSDNHSSNSNVSPQLDFPAPIFRCLLFMSCVGPRRRTLWGSHWNR